MPEQLTFGFYKVEKKKTDLAYMAGIMDADGHIGLHDSHSMPVRYLPTVAVQQVEIEAIQLFHKYYGGNIRKTKRDPKWKQINILVYRKHCKVAEVLTDLLPYLRIKQNQAKLLLEYVNLREAKHMSDYHAHNDYEEHQLFNKMSLLNKVGDK